MAIKWIGAGNPKTWSFKKDIPDHLRSMALRVDFRFCRAWIVRDRDGRVYFGESSNGVTWAAAFDFYLTTPGHVIGLRDRETAVGYPWAMEWRSAMHERIMERLEMGRLA